VESSDSCHDHNISLRLTATASLDIISGIPVAGSFTIFDVTPKVVAFLVFNNCSCRVYDCRSCSETKEFERDMRMFASLMIASCSIARGENFSSSRSKSTGFFTEEEPGRDGGLSSIVALPFCFRSSSGSSLTRYMRRLPVFRPTSNLSPTQNQPYNLQQRDHSFYHRQEWIRFSTCPAA
jgi:hypothetical protein